MVAEEIDRPRRWSRSTQPPGRPVFVEAHDPAVGLVAWRSSARWAVICGGFVVVTRSSASRRSSVADLYLKKPANRAMIYGRRAGAAALSSSIVVWMIGKAGGARR